MAVKVECKLCKTECELDKSLINPIQHFIDSIRGASYYCSGLKPEHGGWAPWPPHFNHWHYLWCMCM